jgi:hypothetical protein
LIAEAQGTPEALSALRDRFLPDRIADVRAMLTGAAARGELRHDEVDIRISLWVGFSWFKLLLGELDDEGVIPSAMTQLADAPRAK